MNWSVFGKAFLCETVYAIPFFILSILPFKKQLRFPVKILILFIFIGQLLQSSLYTYLVSQGKPTRVTDTVFALVSLAIYFLCVKANFWKLLFLGDFILNYFVTVRGICFFLESRLFYDPSITYYSLRDQSLLLISILLLLTLPLGLKFMKNATERVFQVDSSAFWQKVWFIPFSCWSAYLIHHVSRPTSFSESGFLFLPSCLGPWLTVLFTGHGQLGGDGKPRGGIQL